MGLGLKNKDKGWRRRAYFPPNFVDGGYLVLIESTDLARYTSTSHVSGVNGQFNEQRDWSFPSTILRSIYVPGTSITTMPPV